MLVMATARLGVTPPAVTIIPKGRPGVRPYARCLLRGTMMKYSLVRCRSRFVGVILALAVSAGLAASLQGQAAKPQAEEAVSRAAAALYEGIRVDTLPNGLRVYLKPIPGAPTVTTMVAYKVGSADENLDHTGLSHYLEHLMFKGTDKIMPG